MKDLLKSWEKSHPGRVESIFKSLTQVTPSHLLDSQLFDFQDLSLDADPAEGDKAIDEGFDSSCMSVGNVQLIQFD